MFFNIIKLYVSDFGGIYLDTDVLVVKSFEPLRKYNLTLARESRIKLANGIILARPSSLFIRIWLESYATFKTEEYVEHSVIMAQRLYSIFPHHVHVEEDNLVTPKAGDRHILFKEGLFNWNNSYAVHVYYRHGPVPMNLQEMKVSNKSVNEVMRFVYHYSSVNPNSS